VKNLSTFSRSVSVFILIHKIDKIKDSEKTFVFEVIILIFKHILEKEE
jgi:hypothetical protein